MIRIEVPCKDCPDRAERCHSTCDKYQAFHAERAAILEEHHKEVETRDAYYKVKAHVWKLTHEKARKRKEIKK